MQALLEWRMMMCHAAATAMCRSRTLLTQPCSPSPPTHQPAATTSTCLLQLRSTAMTACRAMGHRQARAPPTTSSLRHSNRVKQCHHSSSSSSIISSSHPKTCMGHKGRMLTCSSYLSLRPAIRYALSLTYCAVVKCTLLMYSLVAQA